MCFYCASVYTLPGKKFITLCIMTLVIVYVTTEIHCCTAASCDYGGKTNEMIIIKFVAEMKCGYNENNRAW